MTAWATTGLVRSTFADASFASAADLFTAGTSVWPTNVIASALRFWNLDSGRSGDLRLLRPDPRDLFPSGWFRVDAHYLRFRSATISRSA
jgi:hypothetical protein